MHLDEIDKKILYENFDDETISKIDSDNVAKIFKYLLENNVYYAKDLLLSSLDLFLMPSLEFIEKFEKLKKQLGSNYVERLEEDTSLIESMYAD